MYGYGWEEVVGREFDEIVGLPAERPPMPAIMAMVADNGGRLVETGVPRVCKGGARRFVYASYGELRNSLSELLGYSIMEQDRTESVRLEQKLKESFDRIKETQSATIRGFAWLTEYRDKDTGRHLHRIQDYTRVLASHLRENPRYTSYITDDYIEDLCLSAILHDVGKVGVENSIIIKPGKLTTDEYSTDEGARADRGRRAERRRQRDQAGVVPDARQGDRLPPSRVVGRLRVPRRPQAATRYRFRRGSSPWPTSTTRSRPSAPTRGPFPTTRPSRIIGRERGTHFDPDIVDALPQAHTRPSSRIKLFNEFEENPRQRSRPSRHRPE